MYEENKNQVLVFHRLTVTFSPVAYDANIEGSIHVQTGKGFKRPYGSAGARVLFLILIETFLVGVRPYFTFSLLLPSCHPVFTSKLLLRFISFTVSKIDGQKSKEICAISGTEIQDLE